MYVKQNLDTKREKGGVMMNWEIGTGIYIHYYV